MSTKLKMIKKCQKKKLADITKRCTKHVHLTKVESDRVIEEICPFCEFRTYCIEYLDISSYGHIRKTCILKSDAITNVTIEIGEDKPTVNIDDTFGNLIVVAEAKSDSYGHTYHLCECRGHGSNIMILVIVRDSLLLSGRKTCCDSRRHREGGQFKTRGKQRPLKHQRYATSEYSSRIGCAKWHWDWEYQEDSPWQEIPNGHRIYQHHERVYTSHKCSCGGQLRYAENDLIVCDVCGLIENAREKIVYYHSKIDPIHGEPVDPPGDWRDLIKYKHTGTSEHPTTWPFTQKPDWWSGPWTKSEKQSDAFLDADPFPTTPTDGNDWGDFTAVDQFNDEDQYPEDSGDQYDGDQYDGD